VSKGDGRRRATKGGLSFSRVLFDVHVRAAVEKPNEQRIFVHERAGAVMEDVVLCFPRKRGRVRYQTRCWGTRVLQWHAAFDGASRLPDAALFVLCLAASQGRRSAERASRLSVKAV